LQRTPRWQTQWWTCKNFANQQKLSKLRNDFATTKAAKIAGVVRWSQWKAPQYDADAPDNSAMGFAASNFGPAALNKMW